MQHPGSRGAYALYGAQLFLAGFQHRRKIPEPVDQVVGDTIGVLLGVGQVKHIFQRLVLGQTVQPVVLHPFAHPLAMPLMPFVFCHCRYSPSCSFPIIVPILHRELKALGKNSFDPGRFRVDLQPWLYYYKGIF